MFRIWLLFDPRRALVALFVFLTRRAPNPSGATITCTTSLWS